MSNTSNNNRTGTPNNSTPNTNFDHRNGAQTPTYRKPTPPPPPKVPK